MRTTSLGDADPGTNRTRSDAKGSSFVVNLTADNYPEGATLHTNERPNSAIPAATARSKGSGVSPPVQRKKAENRQIKRVASGKTGENHYSTMSVPGNALAVKNNPQIYVQNDGEVCPRIPEDSYLLTELNQDLKRKPAREHKRGFSAGPRRISKGKGKVISPDSSGTNGLK
jgi:hypothetical protein